MKKLYLAVGVLFAMLFFCGTALAADIVITTEPKNITAAGNVDVKITITNDSNEDMTEITAVGHGINNPANLYSQTLPAGRSLPVNIRGLNISADMIGKPQVYSFTWLEGTTRKSKDVSVTFGSTETAAAMTATRSLSKDSGKEGDKITLTYTLKNPSTVPMTEVTVKDSIAGTSQIAAPFTLEPGTSQSITYEYTLGKQDAVSEPGITYKVDGELKTLEIAAATIKMTNVSLQVAVTQGEPMPEGTLFTLVLTNQGNQDISKISVTDEIGTKVNPETFTLKAGEDKVLTYTVETTMLRNVSFIITGTDAQGQPYENRTKSHETHPYVDPSSIKFAMFVTVIEPLSESGRMKVRFAIQNDSSVEITNATVSEVELGILETRDNLPGGETIIEKELRISEPRELQFTLSAYDPSGTERTYQAQVPAAYMPSSTLDPEQTTAPVEPEETPAGMEGIGNDTLITVLIVLAALMGVAGIALLALSIYERKKSKDMPGYDADDLPIEPVRAKKVNENARVRPARNAPRPRPARGEDKYEPPASEQPYIRPAQPQRAPEAVRPQAPVRQYPEQAPIQQYTEQAPIQRQAPVQQYTEPDMRPYERQLERDAAQFIPQAPTERPAWSNPSQPVRPENVARPEPYRSVVRPSGQEPLYQPPAYAPQRATEPVEEVREQERKPLNAVSKRPRNSVHRVKPIDGE